MFYAFVHKYGPNMRDAEGRRIGYVKMFVSSHMRDKFLSANDNAERIGSKIARSYLTDELLAERPYLRTDAPYLTMPELVNEVRAMRSENWGC